jgi:hypothetical protein
VKEQTPTSGLLRAVRSSTPFGPLRALAKTSVPSLIRPLALAPLRGSYRSELQILFVKIYVINDIIFQFTKYHELSVIKFKFTTCNY